MSRHPTLEGAKPNPPGSAQPDIDAEQSEGMRPTRREEEAASEQGLANPELDHQTSTVRPPLGN